MQRCKKVVRHFVTLRLWHAVTALVLCCHNIARMSLECRCNIVSWRRSNFHLQRTSNVHIMNRQALWQHCDNVFVLPGTYDSYRAPDALRSPSSKKKKSIPKKFLIFQKMELSSSKIKKFPIFPERKHSSLIFFLIQ